MWRLGAAPVRRKYRNQPVTVDGVRFDSQAEAARWLDLQRLQRLGVIRDLQRQVIFTLAPPVKFSAARRATPALRFVADFTYTLAASGERVVEDTKGVRTRAYRLKRHLMKALLGIDVVETS